MEEKEAAIAVAKERLATRSERPDRERVHDEAQSALQNELRVLCSAAQELTHSICKCDDDLARVEAAKAKVDSCLLMRLPAYPSLPLTLFPYPPPPS